MLPSLLVMVLASIFPKDGIDGIGPAASLIPVPIQVTIGAGESISRPNLVIFEDGSGEQLRVTLDEEGRGVADLVSGNYRILAPPELGIALVPDRLRWRPEKLDTPDSGTLQLRAYLGVDLDLVIQPSDETDLTSSSVALESETHKKVRVLFRAEDRGLRRRVPRGVYSVPLTNVDRRFEIARDGQVGSLQIRLEGPSPVSATLSVITRSRVPFTFEIEIQDSKGQPIERDRFLHAEVRWSEISAIAEFEMKNGHSYFIARKDAGFMLQLADGKATLRLASPFLSGPLEQKIPGPTESNHYVTGKVVFDPYPGELLLEAVPEPGTPPEPLTFILHLTPDADPVCHQFVVQMDAQGRARLPGTRYPFIYHAQSMSADYDLEIVPGHNRTTGSRSEPGSPLQFRYRRVRTVRLGIQTGNADIPIGTLTAGPQLFYVQPIEAIQAPASSLRTYSARLRHEWIHEEKGKRSIDLGALPHGRYRAVLFSPPHGTAHTEFEVAADGAKIDSPLALEAPSTPLHGRITTTQSGPLIVVDGRIPLTLCTALQLLFPLASDQSAVAVVEEDGSFHLGAHQPRSPWLTFLSPGRGSWVVAKSEFLADRAVELKENSDLGVLEAEVQIADSPIPKHLTLIVTSLHGGESANPNSELRAEDLQAFPLQENGRFRVFGILPGSYRVGLCIHETTAKDGKLTRSFQYLPETLRTLTIEPKTHRLTWSLPSARFR